MLEEHPQAVTVGFEKRTCLEHKALYRAVSKQLCPALHYYLDGWVKRVLSACHCR